ncbi:protein TE2 [Testudinid alphaherpesvirus 3]|uniref:Protein TE2 n=1 Tax=Testudinid alphaherpesvirus 3 TaxID=2560801 RepID=A0A0K1R1F4_9ALPH|nr:protein TE2 [Testudinid alphaherpesvirus 3]AIU39333.1 protein TE2 [Testudinid alphaherpesvirus 3]AIU39428.1 protein TE2 [Testudinid alphaherpesvirus 3]AKI81703.1 protein TE2 [Testudinid alphaherpesvirus 3]AKI81804.1 protein TE2 [Testudinid alphaherpesvirus 3]AKV40745.1 hypothetical protein [Testudinid alphaherpesvirus 3]
MCGKRLLYRAWSREAHRRYMVRRLGYLPSIGSPLAMGACLSARNAEVPVFGRGYPAREDGTGYCWRSSCPRHGRLMPGLPVRSGSHGLYFPAAREWPLGTLEQLEGRCRALGLTCRARVVAESGHAFLGLLIQCYCEPGEPCLAPAFNKYRY